MVGTWWLSELERGRWWFEMETWSCHQRGIMHAHESSFSIIFCEKLSVIGLTEVAVWDACWELLYVSLLAGSCRGYVTDGSCRLLMPVAA